MLICRELAEKKACVAVIGLGYVGLPVALAFAKKFSVIAFDENVAHVKQLQSGTDPSKEINSSVFLNSDIVFTDNAADIKTARLFLVAVPTPVDEHKIPNLSYLKRATETIGKYLKKGDYVVFESTVYPGCTEEECIPMLEHLSGLQCGIGFKVGYSPERINPGDKTHSFENTVKVVAACDAAALAEIAQVYEVVVTGGVHRAPSIKVAEAAKIVENTQRDLNISLMNELSVIFDKLDIDTGDVLDAAATKWNFMKFTPGLVGGHCIDVDPYYLTYKAKQLGYHSKVIAAGRFVNDEMPGHVAKKIIQHVIKNTEEAARAKVLVLGATFKENVSDIRNSKVIDMVNDLLNYSISIDFMDPHADAAAVNQMYGLKMCTQIGNGYDAIVLAVAHDAYKNFTEEYLLSIINQNALFADLKGIYRNKFSTIKYWSL